MTRGLSRQDRRTIAGRARTLHERLAEPAPGGGRGAGDDPPLDPDDLFDRWVGLFPDRESFDERLAHEGLSETAVRRALKRPTWPDGKPLPEWTARLDSLVPFVETYSRPGRRPAGLDSDTPFAELLVAVAAWGRSRLPDGAAAATDAPGLEAWLVTRLARTGVRALYVEFKSFVEYHDPALAAADPRDVDDPDTTYYERFVDAMFDGGFRQLCVEYPVLARYFVSLVDQWVESTATLWDRIRADREALERRFDVRGSVEELVPLADDAHAGGQVPVRVEFETGSVVYKPRPVDGGVALYAALDGLSEYLDAPSFSSPAFLRREEYGWMEVLSYEDAADETAVERYYRRAGVLLCAAHLLDLPDCQYENLLACGDQPTLLDAETILHSYVRPAAAAFTTEVSAATQESVLRTALLPWKTADDGEDDEVTPFLVAGLGRSSEPIEASEVTKPMVKAVNTDVMRVEGESPTVERHGNTPSVDGRDHPPERYVSELVDGFRRAYDAAAHLRSDGRLRAAVLDPAALEGVENRLVYRPTTSYTSVLRLSRGRDALRDGARLSLELERLAVPFFDGRVEVDDYWGLYEAERRALTRRDVPRFTTRTDDPTIRHDGAPTGVSADDSGVDRLRERLDAMGPAERERQCWLLRRSVDRSGPAPETPARAEGAADDDLRRSAVAHGNAVLDAAMETAAGRRWVSYLGRERTRLRISPAGNALYEGRAGIGLAAAALFRRTGEGRFEALATECLDAVAADAGETETPFGGLAGTGSLVYALAVGADLLDRPAYGDAAATWARAVSPERIAADRALDVVDGSAGLLLALLAHYERHDDPTALARAERCGERLLDARRPVDGYRVWTAGDGRPAVGLAHGASGIGYALARLDAAADDDRYAAAAREALAYEATRYDASESNYALPADGGTRFQDRWCAGRTGCALARLGIGAALDDAEIRAEGADLLAATGNAAFAPYDHLCCGNLGRAVALAEGARRTGRRALESEARAIAGTCLARAERAGTLSMPGHGEAVTNPTLFNGAGGVAYGLLRLTAPDDLPCVLLLE